MVQALKNAVLVALQGKEAFYQQFDIFTLTLQKGTETGREICLRAEFFDPGGLCEFRLRQQDE